MKTVLLTGCTGMLGRMILNELIKNKCKIILLVRSDSQIKAEKRINDLFNLNNISSKFVKILRSDLSQKNLGLEEIEIKKILHQTTHILHAAASTEFTMTLSEARSKNVDTTKNLLDLAKKCLNLERFGYVSTAYVAGKRKGIILEKELDHNSGFLNSYEQSKYEAEILVRQYGLSSQDPRFINKKFPVVIFRPSLIVAPVSSIKNVIGPINALMLGLRLAGKGLLPVLPGNENNILDIIDGALAAKSIIKILLKDNIHFRVYHITSAQNSPKIKELITLIDPEKMLSIHFENNPECYLKSINDLISSRQDINISYLKTQAFIPELALSKLFDNKNLKKELGLNVFSPTPIKSLKNILQI